MSDKSHVSMEQHQCIVCGCLFDTGSILLDKRLRASMEPHTVTGYGLCPEHQKLYDDDYIALVGVDPAQSMPTGGKMCQQDASRTGNVAHLRREVWSDIFSAPLPADADGKMLPMVFVDDSIITRLQAAQEAQP